MENTAHNQLIFVSSSSSDTLNFIIEDTEYLKVKITFLVSDIGHEEEIYGSAVMKMKTGELTASGEAGLTFNKVQIKNQFGTAVGAVSTEIHKGSISNGDANLVNSHVREERDVLDSGTGPFKS